MARRRPLRFFLDNCVPDSVGRALAEFGHEVMYQRNAIVTDAPDVLVALASAQNDAILVTFDKDHKAIASRFIPAARRADWYARCARHGTDLGGGSPLRGDWPEPLAKGNCCAAMRVERKPAANLGTDEQEPDKRPVWWEDP